MLGNMSCSYSIHLSLFKGGGVAGLFVDMVLFPLDTLKTRLQSEQGFRQAGGFKAVYKGIGTQAIGSAPQGTYLLCIQWLLFQHCIIYFQRLCFF